MSISVHLFRHTSLSYSRDLRFWGDGCLARYTGTRNCCENVWPDPKPTREDVANPKARKPKLQKE